MPGVSYLVDTNILLRLSQPDNPEYGTMRRCIDLLWSQSAELFYSSQNLVEFWNVCTRPADKNGFGFSISKTNEKAALIEARLNLIPDSEQAHREWRRIVVDDGVSGIQVHDARLVATMLVHRIERILTLNVRDFRRYAGIIAVSPHDILSGN